MKEIFAIQSDIAQQIAAALKAKLTPAEKERIEKKPTKDIRAYEYYVKGREYYSRYKKEDNEQAIELFKKAIELDPDYALAHAGLGDAYCQRAGRFGFPETWIDKPSRKLKKPSPSTRTSLKDTKPSAPPILVGRDGGEKPLRPAKRRSKRIPTVHSHAALSANTISISESSIRLSHSLKKRLP